MIRRRWVPWAVALVALCGCATAPTATPSSTTAAPQGPLLSQDSDSETLCYAEDIRVSYVDAQSTGTHRCVRAGVAITVVLPARSTLMFATGVSSDPRIATVTPGSVAGATQYVVTTHAPGTVTITSSQLAAGAPQQEWRLSVDVS